MQQFSKDHDTVCLAVYGSLRPSMYNSKGLQYTDKGELKLSYYKMYDLGDYPGVVRSNSFMDTITINILEVDSQLASSIDMMEIHAGYFIIPIWADGHNCKLYLYDKSLITDKHKEVVHGDWIAYYNNKLKHKSNKLELHGK